MSRAHWHLVRAIRAGHGDPVYHRGSAEIAGASTDLVLVRRHGRLHLLARDPRDGSRLAPSPYEDQDVPDVLVGLLA